MLLKTRRLNDFNHITTNQLSDVQIMVIGLCISIFYCQELKEERLLIRD